MHCQQPLWQSPKGRDEFDTTAMTLLPTDSCSDTPDHPWSPLIAPAQTPIHPRPWQCDNVTMYTNTRTVVKSPLRGFGLARCDNKHFGYLWGFNEHGLAILGRPMKGYRADTFGLWICRIRGVSDRFRGAMNLRPGSSGSFLGAMANCDWQGVSRLLRRPIKSRFIIDFEYESDSECSQGRPISSSQYSGPGERKGNSGPSSQSSAGINQTTRPSCHQKTGAGKGFWEGLLCKCRQQLQQRHKKWNI